MGSSTRSTTRTSLLREFSRAAIAYDPFRIRPHEILQSGIFEGGQKGFIGGPSDEEEGGIVDDEAKRLDDECSVSTASTSEESPVKRPPNPSHLTLAEKEAHWACGHLPARPWCPVCLKGRGKEDPHYKKVKHNLEHGLPTVSMDYAEVGNEDEGQAGKKLLIGREDWSGHTFCHLAEYKGLGDHHIVDIVLRSLQTTGRTRINFKTDGEPAIVQLQERIISQREQDTIAVNPQAYDPQSNVLAEKAVQDVKAQLRVLKLGLEARIEHKKLMESPILEWMIPHSADAVNRFSVGKDGRTPHYRLYMRPFKSKIFEFGEQVLAKPERRVGVANQRALAARWHEAT